MLLMMKQLGLSRQISQILEMVSSLKERLLSTQIQESVFSTYTKYYEKRKMVRGPKLMQTDHNSLNIDIHLNKYLICHSFKAHLTINILFPFELKMFFIENLIQEVMLEPDHQKLSNLQHLQFWLTILFQSSLLFLLLWFFYY